MAVALSSLMKFLKGRSENPEAGHVSVAILVFFGVVGFAASSLRVVSAQAGAGNPGFPLTGMTPLTPIRSHLELDSHGVLKKIHYASVAQPDAVSQCRLENPSDQIAAEIRRLSDRVLDSIQKVKQVTQSDRCGSLGDRLKDSRNQYLALMQKTYINDTLAKEREQLGVAPTPTPKPTGPSQDQINEATRRASVIANMVTTANDVYSSDCLSDVDQKKVVQRLIGQTLSLSGLLMGGWSGIATAATGQIMGQLPIFKDPTMTAIEAFTAYQKNSAMESSLCLMRELHKMSCVVFSDPKDMVVGGIDYNFKSGVTAQTKGNFERLSKIYPLGGAEQRILQSAILNRDKLTTYDTLNEYCIAENETMRRDLFSDNSIHPLGVHRAFLELRRVCEQVKSFDFKFDDRTPISQVNESLRLLSVYAATVERSPTEWSHMARTSKSMNLFSDFLTSLGPLRETHQGNTSRMNF
jgi:hypothetical protein